MAVFLIAELTGHGAVAPAAGAAPVAAGGRNSDQFIDRVDAELRQLCRVYITNGVKYSSNYAHRARNHNVQPSGSQQGGGLQSPLPGSRWFAHSLKNINKLVTTRNEGVCSTIGPAAAHALTDRQFAGNSPRVEIISTSAIQGHVFVVVGRAEGSNLQDPSTWGNDARFVDPWHSALNVGSDVQYKYNIRNYPYTHKIPNTLTHVTEWQ